MKHTLIFFCLGILAPHLIFAAEPEHLIFDSYSDFSTGICRTVSLSDEGIIQVAPHLKRFTELKADQIWTILQETNGSYLVGTSPEGRLSRVLSDGLVTEVYKFEGTHIYALAKNNKGEIFVGVSPEGKIYRLNPKGKPTVYFDTKQKYIWDLAFDKSGNLYAATGMEGKVFKITGENQGNVFYASDETHLRCLAFDSSGNLWTGSAETGLLYRISPKGEAVVIASTGKQEVNRISIAPTGEIYFTATGTAKVPSAPNKPNYGPGFANLPSIINDNKGSNDSSISMMIASSLLNGANLQHHGDSNLSQLWKLDASFFPEPIWGTRDTILTLNARDDGVYVGTANDGYLYRISDRGRAIRLLRVESSVLSSTLWMNTSRTMIASSNPAVLYTTDGDPGNGGVYESRVIDSGLFAYWGALRATGNGQCAVRTRSGNTSIPDKTWNPWTELSKEHVLSPPSRYLQFELNLSSGEVDRVDFYFLPRNVAPKIDLLQILSTGIGYIPITSPPSTPQSRSIEQLLSQGSHPDNESIFQQTTRFQPIQGKGLRTAVWKVSNLNGDDLLYTVSFRNSNSKTWYVLAKDLKDPVFSWDSSGWEDGQYYLKITASDRSDNMAQESLSDELESRMFFVDNTPPTIQIISINNGVVHFRVKEDVSGLKSVTVSHDGKEYLPISPINGILDSPTEDFEDRVNKDQILFIRAEDNSGNVSGTQVVGR